jgi:hypothetical protein
MSNESGHWYTRDGKAAHTQKTKPGAKNPTRPTTIRDAKEQDLLPSVSGITRVMSAPGLDYYKNQQLVKACFDCPATGDENFDDYFKHVSEKSGQDAGGAAELGTVIHAALESYYAEPLIYTPHDILVGDQAVNSEDFIRPVDKAIKELGLEVMHAEKVLVNDAYGYAGTTDIIFKTADSYGVADFKTTRTKPGKPKEPNESHPLQIAAYIAAFWGEDYDYPIGPKAKGYNIFISTTEIGRVEIKEWSYEELITSWDVFNHCLALWRWRNGYDPRCLKK